MKIIKAEIIDPRTQGEYKDPYVELTVDEAVREMNDPVRVPSLSYRMIPCGPFFAVEYQVDTDEWADVEDGNSGDIGEFNTMGLTHHQLAPVIVKCDGEPDLPLFMAVTRLRRVVRKFYAHDWKVIIDEEAGMIGGLKWRLELSNPVCYGGAMPFQARCYAEPIKTIMVKDTHLTMCHKHVTQSERIMSQLRAAR